MDKANTEKGSKAFALLIDLCLDLLEKPQPLTDRSGFIVTGDDGKPFYRKPNAAEMKVILELCKQIGIGAHAAPGSKASTLRERMPEHWSPRLAGLPEVDMSGQDAAGGVS